MLVSGGLYGQAHRNLYTKEGVDKKEAVELIRSVLEPLVGVVPRLMHMEVRSAYQGGMDYALYSEFASREAWKLMGSIRPSGGKEPFLGNAGQPHLC